MPNHIMLLASLKTTRTAYPLVSICCSEMFVCAKIDREKKRDRAIVCMILFGVCIVCVVFCSFVV